MSRLPLIKNISSLAIELFKVKGDLSNVIVCNILKTI